MEKKETNLINFVEFKSDGREGGEHTQANIDATRTHKDKVVVVVVVSTEKRK